MDTIFADFIETLERKKIVQREKTDKLSDLSLKGVSGLRSKLKKALLDLYKGAKSTASAEIFKSKFAKPIVSEKFLKMLEDETYQFIGDWEYNVTKNARLAIIAAIKDGKPIAQVVDILGKETTVRRIKDALKKCADAPIPIPIA